MYEGPEAPAASGLFGLYTVSREEVVSLLTRHATFEHTTFEGGLVPDRDPEDAIVFRAQVAF
jgi:hypothetical protein